MDQQKRMAGAMITAMLMFFCAFIFLCLGMGFVLSYPDKVWPVGILFLGCCAAMIHGGISNIRLSGKIGLDANNQLQQIKSLNTNGVQPSDEVIQMAKWTYDAGEWKSFLKWEKQQRKSSSTIEAMMILVLGTLYLRYIYEATWLVSLGSSGGVAIAYWIGKYYLSMRSIGKAKNNEVIITNRSVIINGKVNAFRDGQYWLKTVSLRDDTDPAVLEIVYGWETRKGDSHETIRVPVPKENIEDARRLARQL